MDLLQSPSQEISKLPKEILEEIFQRLPFRDLLKCREVHSTWKSAATVPIRKRCKPLNFSREDLPSKHHRIRAIESFLDLVRATNEQGGLAEFPVAKFQPDLNLDYFWTEVEESTIICRFLEAISPFARQMVFVLSEKNNQVPQTPRIGMPHDLTFPNLTEITLGVFKCINQHCDREIFSLIKNIIEKSPNIKEFQLEFDSYNAARSHDTIRRCVDETGILPRAKLVSSLSIMIALNAKHESALEYFSKVGFKLKHFQVTFGPHDVNPEIWKNFLDSHSDTLSSLIVRCENGSYFRNLPCLPGLKNLSIRSFLKPGLEQLPTRFYKEQLQALKKMDLDILADANYFAENHLAPTESLQELVLGIYDAAPVICQVARIFPNLRKLQIFHDKANDYMSDIYTALPGIEELCISTEGRVSVDDIITGLPGNILGKIRTGRNPTYHFSKALAMLDQGTTKTLASLENLKVLEISRKSDAHDFWKFVGSEDFSELSGVVLKQMKSLHRVDFGIRKYGPVLSTALKQDLEAHGIKLSCREPPYTRSRTDLFVSITDPDVSDSDSD